MRSSPIPTTRTQVVAFRLGGHHLDSRLSSEDLIEAAAACGLQNSPPGSAALSFHARVRDLTPEDVTAAVEDEKTLVQTWCMRASPHFVQSSDLPVFTAGLLPETVAEWRHVLAGFVNVLDEVDASALDAVDRTVDALYDALDGTVLTKREMGAELGKRLPAALQPWMEPDEFSAFGATLVRPIALTGLFCIAPRRSNVASFVRTDQWLDDATLELDDREVGLDNQGLRSVLGLGGPPSEETVRAARRELVRRYLRCYGPSTAEHFGEWAGIDPDQAERTWSLVEDDLVEVTYDGESTWIHRDDRSTFVTCANPRDGLTGESARAGDDADGSPARAVRLLPPHDPYLQARDRETILPDTDRHGHVWRSVGNPGVVLVDGEAVASWRAPKKGSKLAATVTAFDTLSRAARSVIEREFDGVARFKGCRSVDLEFDDVADES